MDITKQMNEQLKIDDHKYALEMLPAMPKPVLRYIEQLQSEYIECMKRVLRLLQENDELDNRRQNAENLAENSKQGEEIYKSWIRDLEQQIQEMRDEYDELSLSYRNLEITHQEDRAQITKYENQIEHTQRITTNQANTISELLTRIEELEKENRSLNYYDLKKAFTNRSQP